MTDSELELRIAAAMAERQRAETRQCLNRRIRWALINESRKRFDAKKRYMRTK